MAAINFQAQNYEPAAALDPVPPSWYTAIIAESELKDCSANAKDPNGKYYSFVFQIVEGPYVNRKVYANYTVVNVNAQAVDIAYKDLASLYRAIGAEKEQINDTQQLHNRPMEIKVKVSPARGDYDASNVIASGGYRAVGSAALVAGIAPSVPAAPGAPPVAPAAPPAPPVAPAAPPVAPVAPAAPAPAAPAVPAAPAAPVAPQAPVAPAAPPAPAAVAPTAPPAPVAPTAPVAVAPVAAPVAAEVAPVAPPVAAAAAPAAPWDAEG